MGLQATGRAAVLGRVELRDAAPVKGGNLRRLQVFALRRLQAIALVEHAGLFEGQEAQLAERNAMRTLAVRVARVKIMGDADLGRRRVGRALEREDQALAAAGDGEDRETGVVRGANSMRA